MPSYLDQSAAEGPALSCARCVCAAAQHLQLAGSKIRGIFKTTAITFSSALPVILSLMPSNSPQLSSNNFPPSPRAAPAFLLLLLHTSILLIYAAPSPQVRLPAASRSHIYEPCSYHPPPLPSPSHLPPPTHPLHTASPQLPPSACCTHTIFKSSPAAPSQSTPLSTSTCPLPHTMRRCCSWRSW